MGSKNISKTKKKCIILLSGGLDSTTVLAVAANKGYECYALSFNYGQRHKIELEAAKKIASCYKVVEHKIVNVDFLTQIGHSALTDLDINVPEYNFSISRGSQDNSIPSTYVPARNTIFISIAFAWAEVICAQEIFIGASSIDYSGYPDCRPEYFKSFQSLLNLATKNATNKITIEAPLLYLSKAQTVQLGKSLNVNYYHTVSCYQADANGYACGKCDSCVLRKNGFAQANLLDETNYIA